MSFFEFIDLPLLAAQAQSLADAEAEAEARPGPSQRRVARDQDAPQPHVIDFFPVRALGEVAPFLSPPHITAVLSFLSVLSRTVMEQTSGTSTPTGGSATCTPKMNDLPELPDEGASSSQTPGKVAVDENTDISTLTPSQLYELNQELLNDSTSSDRPLIAPVAPMEALREEYERGSQSFVRQIDFLLKKGYHGDPPHAWRRRLFLSLYATPSYPTSLYPLAFAYIERILSSADRPLAVMTAISTLDAALPMLDAAGFQKMVYEDFYEVFAELIRAIETPGPEGKTLSHETLLQSFQNPEVSNYVVVFLRLLASAQIRTDPESYAPFLFHPDLGESMTPREFCESFVEAVGKEADHVQVTALSRALKINVSVAYLDGHSSDGHVDFVEFVNARDEKEPPLVLLYRPGHYDILDNGTIEGVTF
ncbi:hypothetical protein EVG20_g9315 [Dentipellis fragilis]|uniref:Uncharacterized protein n=1 Tax=Dentipellis fragilis TaxID=205917 RepID=A0A4Y9Y1K1_9AGAM|nr:hypothetical protein EVG20_g9315 [Dentipellis fragilis]